jgi:hypothetical protein
MNHGYCFDSGIIYDVLDNRLNIRLIDLVLYLLLFLIYIFSSWVSYTEVLCRISRTSINSEHVYNRVLNAF